MWVLPSEPAPELCVSCSSSVFTFSCIIPVVFLPWFLHLWLLFVYILSVCVYIKARLCDRAEQERTLQIYGGTFIAQTTCDPCWISSLFSRNKTSWD